MSSLLDIQNLHIAFENRRKITEVVRGVSFAIEQGETLALVGESGSGKSVTALSISQLLPPSPQCVVSGSIFFEGRDLLKLNAKGIRAYRGREIAYVFQEPSSSLHPQFTVGEQLREVIAIHQPEVVDHKKAVVEALDRVGIRAPDERYHDYPFQMSGGMLQRVMIAMALACRSKLLIADEPTTALDVTIQAQVLDLIQEIQKEQGLTVLMITHNFGIVDGFADRLLVMNQGQVVEAGETRQVLRDPQDPYTRGLINCIPRLGRRDRRLATSGTLHG